MAKIVDMKFDFPDWADKVRAAEHEILVSLAASMQTNRGMLFNAEGSYSGHEKWKGLAFRNGQILSDRGTLRQSIAPFDASGRAGPDGIVKIEGEVVTIGTELIYANLMNYGTANMPGGVLRPKKAKALMIPLPKGKSLNESAKGMKTTKVKSKSGKTQNVIFRKWVRIPARDFISVTPQDVEEFEYHLAAKITEVMSRG